MCLIYGVLSHLMVLKSVLWRFTLLCREFFCRNLRAFVWRKIVSKIVCVEKKRQISGKYGGKINGDIN